MELAGRDEIIENATVALDRVKLGRPGRSQMLLGLRGVGKTVLLNRIFNLAEDRGYLTLKIEAPENGDFAQRMLPDIKRAMLRLSTVERIKDNLALAGAGLRNFCAMWKLSYEGFEFGASEAPGVAQSGDFETDFAEMMRLVLVTAKAAERQIALFVDEVQYLNKDELSALAVTCHDASQRALPFLFFGAGLPQIAKLAGDAKSYSERLFEFPEVGSLGEAEGARALIKPAEREDVSYEKQAVSEIISRSQTYPYFLQEWGAHAWNQARSSPITLSDVDACAATLQTHLDASFFRVRFDRCKPLQQKYLRAMAELGPGPHQTGDIAAVLRCEASQVAGTRAQLISLGMIWSQRHGETAFTVPLFDEFMKRQMPKLEPHVPKRRK